MILLFEKKSLAITQEMFSKAMARNLSETYTDTAIPRVMGYAQRSKERRMFAQLFKACIMTAVHKSTEKVRSRN